MNRITDGRTYAIKNEIKPSVNTGRNNETSNPKRSRIPIHVSRLNPSSLSQNRWRWDRLNNTKQNRIFLSKNRMKTNISSKDYENQDNLKSIRKPSKIPQLKVK